jgi:hypothetical protein
MIVYVSGNLLWATRIRAAAEDVGVTARPARDAPGLARRLSEGPVATVVVDLDGTEDALGLVRLGVAARAEGRVGRVAAFGPHVRTDLLEGAREAGADPVLVRGAFDHRLGELLREWGGGAP